MATKPRKRCSRAELLKEAFWIMHRRLMNFSKAEHSALRALQRKFPGFSKQQYSNALKKVVEDHDVAWEIVSKHGQELLKQTELGRGKGSRDKWSDLQPFRPEIKRRCPGYRLRTYKSILLRVFIGVWIR